MKPYCYEYQKFIKIIKKNEIYLDEKIPTRLKNYNISIDYINVPVKKIGYNKFIIINQLNLGFSYKTIIEHLSDKYPYIKDDINKLEKISFPG